MNFLSKAVGLAGKMLKTSKSQAIGNQLLRSKQKTRLITIEERQEDWFRQKLFSEQAVLKKVSYSDESLWLNELAKISDSQAVTDQDAVVADIKEETQTQDLTKQLAQNLFELVSILSQQFNLLVDYPTLRVTMITPSQVNEVATPALYYRWRASTRFFSLSARAKNGIIEIFQIPVGDIMLNSVAESQLNLKGRFTLVEKDSESQWTMDGLPVGADDIKVFVRNIFKDLIRASAQRDQLDDDVVNLSNDLDGTRLTQVIQQMIFEKQNLAQKIVNQQEEIQRRIARDLHDAVIADVMMLRRELAETRKTARKEIITILDRITQRLREICYELSPRDLKDWGLQTVVQDLLEQTARRTKADCTLNCDIQIPDLEYPVQLHIYRIIQESLNNIEKYACASRVVISIDIAGEMLTIAVADNGKGFDSHEIRYRRAKDSGMGLASMREHAGLICSFYPATLSMESQPAKGTIIKLTLKL